MVVIGVFCCAWGCAEGEASVLGNRPWLLRLETASLRTKYGQNHSDKIRRSSRLRTPNDLAFKTHANLPIKCLVHFKI